MARGGREAWRDVAWAWRLAWQAAWRWQGSGARLPALEASAQAVAAGRLGRGGGRAPLAHTAACCSTKRCHAASAARSAATADAAAPALLTFRVMASMVVSVDSPV